MKQIYKLFEIFNFKLMKEKSYLQKKRKGPKEKNKKNKGEISSNKTLKFMVEKYFDEMKDKETEFETIAENEKLEDNEMNEIMQQEIKRNDLILKEMEELEKKTAQEIDELIKQKGFEFFIENKGYDYYYYLLMKSLSNSLSDYNMFKEDYTTYIYNNLRALMNSKELDDALKKIAYDKDKEFLFKEFHKLTNYRWDNFINLAKKYQIDLLQKYIDSVNPEIKNKKKEEEKNQTNNENKEKFEMKKAIEIFQHFPEDNQLELFVAGIVYTSMIKRRKEELKDKMNKIALLKDQLEIQNFNLCEVAMVSVLNGIKYNKNIVEINLCGNSLSPKSSFCLGQCIKTLPFLTTLDLTRSNLDNDKLYMFAEGLKFSDENLNKAQFGLEKLILKDNADINDNNAKNSEYEHPLAIILEKCKLKNLNLINTKLGSNGASKLFKKMEELLEKNQLYLENLNLIGNNIQNEECLKVLGDLLLKDNCPLRSLILSKNLISTFPEQSANPNINYFEYLMKCIAKSKLKELYLISCDIGINEQDKNIIYEMLKENKSLISIRLFGNKISDMNSFTKILGIFSDYNKQLDNNILKCLDLSKNQINIKVDDNFMKLIESLKLEYLDINQNNFQPDEKEIFRKKTNELSDIRIIY